MGGPDALARGAGPGAAARPRVVERLATATPVDRAGACRSDLGRGRLPEPGECFRRLAGAHAFARVVWPRPRPALALLRLLRCPVRGKRRGGLRGAGCKFARPL